MTQETLSRTINLPAASFLIIGYVVGATIFILPGSLAAEAGPAIYIAYLMAAVPAVLACLVMAVIGSAIPASGSLYLIIRDVLSQSLGFLYLWLMVAMAAMVIPLVAFGFADYFTHFYAGLDSRVAAIVVIALFIVINYLGMEVASGFQNLMVIGFILALLIFSIGGLTHADPALMKPLLPLGWSPIVVAAMTAYFSYAGVFIIAASALFAAATSVNGIMMGLSRDFYKGAKSGLFPRYFAAIHPRSRTPGRAVLVVGALSLAGVLASGSIVQYAQIAVLAIMVIQIVSGIALMKLPGKMPEVYEASTFKLGIFTLRFVCVCYIAFSVVFLVVLGMEQPDAIVSGLIFIAIGYAWYFLMVRKSDTGVA